MIRSGYMNIIHTQHKGKHWTRDEQDSKSKKTEWAKCADDLCPFEVESEWVKASLDFIRLRLKSKWKK